MSFNVMLYRNRSPINQVNKTLAQVTTITGTQRDSSSILDPVIMTDGLSQSLSTVNYMWIPSYGRFYFVNNIVTVNNRLWAISGHVDVLMSYREQILIQNGIVSRSSSTYNTYLNDGNVITYENPRIITKKFSVAAPFDTLNYVLIATG